MKAQKIGLFKEIYGAVTGNIAMNIIIGSALGGVRVVEGGAVVIAPRLCKTVSSISIVHTCFLLSSSPPIPSLSRPEHSLTIFPEIRSKEGSHSSEW